MNITDMHLYKCICDMYTSILYTYIHIYVTYDMYILYIVYVTYDMREQSLTDGFAAAAGHR